MRVYLIVVGGKKEGMVIPATGKQFLIGRDEGCHLRLTQKHISPKHCVILTEGKSAYLEDLGSASGTLVGGKPIYSQYELCSGDRFKIGEVQFEIRLIETKERSDYFSGDPSEMLSWLNKYSKGKVGDLTEKDNTKDSCKNANRRTPIKIRSLLNKSNFMLIGTIFLGSTLIGIAFIPTPTWEQLWTNIKWPLMWITFGVVCISTAVALQKSQN